MSSALTAFTAGDVLTPSSTGDLVDVGLLNLNSAGTLALIKGALHVQSSGATCPVNIGSSSGGVPFINTAGGACDLAVTAGTSGGTNNLKFYPDGLQVLELSVSSGTPTGGVQITGGVGQAKIGVIDSGANSNLVLAAKGTGTVQAPTNSSAADSTNQVATDGFVQSVADALAPSSTTVNPTTPPSLVGLTSTAGSTTPITLGTGLTLTGGVLSSTGSGSGSGSVASGALGTIAYYAAAGTSVVGGTPSTIGIASLSATQTFTGNNTFTGTVTLPGGYLPSNFNGWTTGSPVAVTNLTTNDGSTDIATDAFVQANEALISPQVADNTHYLLAPTSTLGATQVITLGSNLSIASGVLSATGGGGSGSGTVGNGSQYQVAYYNGTGTTQSVIGGSLSTIGAAPIASPYFTGVMAFNNAGSAPIIKTASETLAATYQSVREYKPTASGLTVTLFTPSGGAPYPNFILHNSANFSPSTGGFNVTVLAPDGSTVIATEAPGGTCGAKYDGTTWECW
jgi:hypothetical protein